MTLQKAIEILTLMGTPEFDGHTEDRLAAQKLGIEALIRVRDDRRTSYQPVWYPLARETKY